jgi:hypothetical protein
MSCGTPAVNQGGAGAVPGGEGTNGLGVRKSLYYSGPCRT